MVRESEIKLPIGDIGEVRNRCIALGARLRSERCLEDNLVFDSPDASLRRQGKLLRLRQFGPEVLVTFKGPTLIRNSIKHREETEFHIDSHDAFGRLLAQLGYVVQYRYQKYRQVLQLAERFLRSESAAKVGGPAPERSLYLMLDETPIGNFLELEGEEDLIVAMAALLGFSPADFLTESYAVLHETWRRKQGLPPGDMIFNP